MKQLISKMGGIICLLAGTLAVQAAGPSGDGFAANGSFGAVAKASPRRAAPAGETMITTSVVYPHNAVGMWNFPLDRYEPAQLVQHVNANAGGFAANDGYYYAGWYSSMSGIEALQVYSYDIAKGFEQYDNYNNQPLENVATTMAYSPWRDAAYGCFFNKTLDGYVFAKWQYSYFRKDVEICPLERPWAACAFDSKSQLYALEENGDLYRVDLFTGAMTKVGSTGVKVSMTGDAVIDPATDIMYWCVGNDTENALYSVNLNTAAAKKLYDLAGAEQLAGMYIDEPAPAAEAPDKVSSFSIRMSTPSVKMSVPLQWSMPRYTVSQQALPEGEDLKWYLYDNGNQVATGTAAKGTTVSQTVDLTSVDYHCFTVVTENSAGKSPKKQVTSFFGSDSPKAPSSVNMTVSGNTVTVQWSSISSSGIHGGAVNSSSATYTVTRQPDGKVVGENLTASNRKVVDEITVPEKRTEYWYEVQAEVDGVKAPVAKSPTVAFGPLAPAFEVTFPTNTSLAGWTVADANADGTKWGWYSSYKSAYISGSKGFDDYLVTPAVDVQAGFTYPLTVSLRTSNYYDETFEVLYGTSPDPAAMTSVAIAPETYKGTEFKTFTGSVKAEATGKIYIAVHAKTGTPSNSIYVEKIALGEGSNVMAPGQITDLQFTLPRDGTVAATLSFKAPATNVEGDALEGKYALTKVEILRDGAIVHTIDTGLSAGAALTWTDKSDDLTIGNHAYSVTASNAYGSGLAEEKTVFVGPNAAAAPASARFVEEGNSGKVTVSWAAVTADAEGNTLLPGLVTYRVIDRDGNTVADDVKETSVTVQAVPEGSQKFIQFAVYAKTAGGESTGRAVTDYKCAGTPSMAPWKESFSNCSISSPFGYNYIKGQEPWAMVSTTDNGYQPQDGDAGFMYFEAYGGVVTALLTGKIDLSEVVSPALIYYSYNYASDYKNTITVQVDNGDGNGFRDVQTDVIAEAGPVGQWNRIVVPLDEFALQTIMVRFMPGNVQGAFFTLDNLSISSFVDYNLSARSLDIPSVVDPDKEFEVSFTAVNSGQKAVGRYSMQLWRGDNMVASKDMNGIEPDQTVTAVFTQILGVADGYTVPYHAVVSANMDEIETDNASETMEVGVAIPVVPQPAALAAAQAGSALELTWQAPDRASAQPAPYTESFEDAQGWAKSVEGWQMVDMDKVPMGGITDSNNPVQFPVNGLCAWYVVDNDHAFITGNSGASLWASHTGSKHIASSYSMRDGKAVQSDDWAISPRLYGGPQAVSFWIRSFQSKYPESAEVLYSDKTTAIEDFVSAGSLFELPSVWGRVRVMLPDGARYLAIRSRSIDKHQLFVDDITFVPAEGPAAELDLKGYNVYRDGVKLNAEPVAQPSYVDTEFPASGSPEYFVTAVYESGESAPSNRVSVSFSGIAGVEADGTVAVRVEGRDIVVTGSAASVTVVAADGRVMAVAEAAPVVRTTVLPGVYVVRTGATAVKVVVR